MNIRKHIPLVVGGSILVILMVVEMVVLFSAQRQYSKTNSSLRSQQDRLNILNRRKPYPSEENIEKARNNFEKASEHLNELRIELRKDQIEAENIEAAQFPPLLEKTVKLLRERAGDKVIVPNAFGFPRYHEGALPVEKDIPRLVIQLKIIKNLSETLIDANVSEIVAIKRELFDNKVEEEKSDTQNTRRDRRSRRRRQPQQPVQITTTETNDLYEIEKLELKLRVRQNVVWDILNKLAKSKVFCVVTSIELSSSLPEAPKQTISPLTRNVPNLFDSEEDSVDNRSHNDRIIAGQEEVEMKLYINVYRFKEEPTGENETQENG